MFVLFFRFRPEKVLCFKEVDNCKLLRSGKFLVIWHSKPYITFYLLKLLCSLLITKVCSGWAFLLFLYLMENKYNSKPIKIAKLPAEQQNYPLFRQNIDSGGLNWLGECWTICSYFLYVSLSLEALSRVWDEKVCYVRVCLEREDRKSGE